MYLSEKYSYRGTNICPRKMEEGHEDFQERLRKTFYYGKHPGTERPSLPVTDLLVDFYNEAAPRELGKLDNYFAASASRSACISPSSVMAGMVYVKRLKKRQPDYMTQVSSSELFLISMMMASKFLYDEGIDEEVFNDEWATSGDLDTEDVNQLELDFLAAIDWQLFVGLEEFSDMLNKVEKRIALKQGLERGWFSYTDLMVLSRDLKLMNWKGLLKELSTVFSATSLAYMAGILTMVGSTLIGTATPVTLMKAGSLVAPLCMKALPVLTLYPELTLDIRNSGPLPTVNQSEFSGFGAAELESLVEVDFEQLKEQNKSDVDNFVVAMDNHEETDTVESNDHHPKAHSKSQHRDQNRLLNGFLPPFLALVTLKDTIVNFVNGARLSREQKDVNHGDNDLELADLETSTEATDRICSMGPCLVDSMPNCWNVTIEMDWTSQGAWTENNCFDKKWCRSHCSELDSNNPGLDFATWKGAGIIHCCCLHGNTGNSWLKGSLQPSLTDTNLRFATRSFYPIFVTT